MLTEYERVNYEGAGFIFMTFDMKFLLVREVKSGKWGMCKGHRERKDNGDPTNTAKREAFEELGLLESDYEINGNQFVIPGSPKIYVFQCARLKTDMMRLFYETKVGLTTGSRKLREITEIKMVSYYDLIHDLNNYENNVYVRLLQAHLSGTYIPPTPKKQFVEKKVPVTPFDSPKSDLERLSTGGDSTQTTPKKFFNSGVIGGSPILITGMVPNISPIIAPQSGELDLPPLQLKQTEETLYPTGRASPIKRERTESGGSLLEALRGSPTFDRGSTPSNIGGASPFCSYPPSSPSVNIYGGGSGSGSISPRTCAANMILPTSPTI